MSGKLILQHQDQHRVEKEETTIPVVPEIDQEIECPRCYETMVLSSDFDKLCYCCEECNFSLKIS
ncbi:MAG TPA: hypothetical protein VE643_06725 [Nitrososphaeraceae archaeon]|nr:hypothetical protein [Nitrososphaeraceae archaeon]